MCACHAGFRAYLVIAHARRPARQVLGKPSLRGSQAALRALSFEPTLARLFASTPWSQVEELARWSHADDPYGEREAIRRALAIVGADVDASGHVLHQLWSAWRQAAWTSGVAEPLQVTLEGAAHLAETEGHPTLLVTAMTLAPADAIDAIARTRSAGRPCIVFGEDMDTEGQSPAGDVEIVTGISGATIRRILDVLDAGGILCTYPDFVYDYRSADTIRLYGLERPVASGFVSLASRNGTMLLPLLCSRAGSDKLVVDVFEPVEVVSDGSGREAARALIRAALSSMLEEIIGRAGDQWLLLPTLTFESPQMASTAAANRA
jgi:hypothetical protein